MSMTETERLREMLDEHGVKWWGGYDAKTTCFDGASGVRYLVDGTLGRLFIRSMLHVTPEQAIEATLGRGECHKVHGEYGHWPSCSECGNTLAPRFAGGVTNYCPRCGAKVVDE